MSKMDDDDMVSHEVGRSWDDRIWTLKASADKPMTEKEFAAVLISLGKDILSGRVSWDDAEDITNAN